MGGIDTQIGWYRHPIHRGTYRCVQAPTEVPTEGQAPTHRSGGSFTVRRDPARLRSECEWIPWGLQHFIVLLGCLAIPCVRRLDPAFPFSIA